jgi:hypothetical protein
MQQFTLKLLVKKIVLFLITIFIVHFCGAQVTFGFFAGPQATTVRYFIHGNKQSSQFKYGFHAGTGLKVFFDKQLYFAPSINYSLMGYKVKFNQPSFPPDTSALDNNTSFHQIDLNLLLQYDLGNSPGHFFINAGVAVNLVLFGNEEYNCKNNSHVSQSMIFSIYNYYGRYLTSAITKFGYETPSGVFINAFYVHGLGSMNNAQDGPLIKNQVIGISFGKYLNPKKIVIDTRNKE